MFDRLVRQFTWRPGVDGTTKIGWWETGQVDDLDNLFGRKAAGRAGARGIGQHGGDQGAQLGGMGFDGGELGFEPRLQRIDERFAAPEPHTLTFLSRAATDVGLNRI